MTAGFVAVQHNLNKRTAAFVELSSLVIFRYRQTQYYQSHKALAMATIFVHCVLFLITVLLDVG